MCHNTGGGGAGGTRVLLSSRARGEDGGWKKTQEIVGKLAEEEGG